MINKSLAKLHKFHGEQVFLEAQRALLTPPRKTFRLIASYGVAAVLLLLPVLAIGFGLWLLISGFGTLAPMFWGAVLLGVGYVLAPRPTRQTERSFLRAELPVTFGLIDAIAKALGVESPDAFRVLMEPNASAATYGMLKRQNVIAIGMPLWRVMTPQERIAILAHEMAHFGNGDPARGTFIWYAMQVVSRWEYLLAPDVNPVYAPSMASWVTASIQFLCRLPVSALGNILLYLQYYDSQRAEYLADGMAAKAGGVEAMKSSLAKFALLDEAYGAGSSLYPYSKEQNARVFDVIAEGLRMITPARRVELAAVAAKETARVDASHPPTAHRIAFLGLLESGTPAVEAAAFNFEEIERELQSEADRLGRKLMQSLEEQ
jgi:Zn-dependent protease with chaperone function